ncbi:hypothetical protein [Actinophytocola sediminis]
MNDTGYSVKIDTIMELAKKNYDIAERYEGITRKLADTDLANVCLADQYGEATAADTEVIAIIDEFFEYLRTTTARYQLTGEQLEQAAAAYVQTDTEQEQVYRRYRDEFDEYGVGDHFEGDRSAVPEDERIDPDEDAEATDRPDEANEDQAPGFGTDENPREPDEDSDNLDGLERVGDDRRGGAE